MLPQTLTEHQITCASKQAMIIWHLCYDKIRFAVFVLQRLLLTKEIHDSEVC